MVTPQWSCHCHSSQLLSLHQPTWFSSIVCLLPCAGHWWSNLLPDESQWLVLGLESRNTHVVPVLLAIGAHKAASSASCCCTTSCSSSCCCLLGDPRCCSRKSRCFCCRLGRCCNQHSNNNRARPWLTQACNDFLHLLQAWKPKPLSINSQHIHFRAAMGYPWLLRIVF